MRYISTAYMIERVAEMLGEDVLFIEGIASEMMPEDGRINIVGLNDEQTIVFTTPASIACSSSFPNIAHS